MITFTLSLVALIIGYFFYGRLVERIFGPDTRNYQLVLSMDDLSEDDAAEMIIDYIERTSK